MPVRTVLLLVAIWAPQILSAHGPVGFANEVTGGRGGPLVAVRTAEEFKTALENAGDAPLVVQIHGSLEIGTVQVGANKSIEGVGLKPKIKGNIFLSRGSNNVIIRNLVITNPSSRKKAEGFDGITIRGGRRIWIGHCTFIDCADGSVDISHGADLVTVSWCKFQYSSKKLRHRFVMLAYGPPKKSVKSPLRLTLHHNWFAKNCGSRMPAALKAHVHMFNNYFDCPDNSYATNARKDTWILSENNFYRKIRNPFYKEKNARLKSVDNIYEKCSGKLDRGRDDVFDPPYPYTLTPVRDVPELVRAKAGCQL